MLKKTKANHYINNEEFLDAMVSFRNSVHAAKDANEPRPKISDYLGECFLKIGTHLSYKPNFINYTFRDDLVSDGIENCLLYAHNFNPEKSKNPFSYFTQIIHHAYVRRIVKERKLMHIKYLYVERSGIMQQLSIDGEDNKKISNQYVEYLHTHEKYAENPHKKKPKKTKHNLELYF